MLCPKDGSPCVDSICRANGCLLMDGLPMIGECETCGKPQDHNLSCCSCDDDDEDDTTFDDDIETEYEKRGCTFIEYKNFVSGM